MNERIRGTVLVSLFWFKIMAIYEEDRSVSTDKTACFKNRNQFLNKDLCGKNRNFFIGQRKKKEKDSAKIKKNEKMEADTACLTTI